MRLALISVVLLGLSSSVAGAAQGLELDTAKIESLTGLKGQLNDKEGVFKVSYPRSDIEAIIAGVKATPPMGLTAWAAFTKAGKHTMVMGDMVLLEDQVTSSAP